MVPGRGGLRADGTLKQAVQQGGGVTSAPRAAVVWWDPKPICLFGSAEAFCSAEASVLEAPCSAETSASAAPHAGRRARTLRDTRPSGALLEQQLLGGVRRHHEALAVASGVRGDVEADDPDDLALQVEHGPARVAGVDRGISLEKLGEGHGPVRRVRRPARADGADAE